MITQKSPIAMTAIKQPSRHLTIVDWNALEIKLVSAMLSKATAQQLAVQGRAL